MLIGRRKNEKISKKFLSIKSFFKNIFIVILIIKKDKNEMLKFHQKAEAKIFAKKFLFVFFIF
jgi:hypothetical protein